MYSKEIIQYLEDHKKYVGLHGWRILLALKPSPVRDGEGSAEVDPDIFDQKLKIKIDPSFLEETQEDQERILLHELIHARIQINYLRREQLIESIDDQLEEELANDLERGMFQLLQQSNLNTSI